MKIAARSGPWSAVATDEDSPSAGYTVDYWIPDDRPVDDHGSLETVRVMVELRAQFGGRTPIAALGGYLEGGRRADGPVRVGATSQLTLGATPTCLTSFGPMLVPGLPPEFADAVFENLMRSSMSEPLEGAIVVDRAAYSEVESSAAIFGRAAHALFAVMSAVSKEREPLQALDAVLAGFEAWG